MPAMPGKRKQIHGARLNLIQAQCFRATARSDLLHCDPGNGSRNDALVDLATALDHFFRDLSRQLISQRLGCSKVRLQRLHHQ